ncbi:ATP-dependent Clp protease adaptor protein ClpS [hydrothermal vent metagenome]|uniref:ATP-dependent Clp protease adaptor protein ClpS n=1 Tax=hydrothermal vent metagenome TaxID=652676 RepID=A0A1W1D564_9ZZZZ
MDFEYELSDEIEITFPKRYKVIMLNDDYTSMDFVVDVLMTIFHKSNEEANNIMLNIHTKGQGVCGIYPYEIAETKVMQVTKRAKESGFPLKVIMEEETND